MYKKESMYIAGPECFYENGYKIWHWYREKAEIHGFTVTLPNQAPLKLDHEDLRKNADEIFSNCTSTMNASTVIIANLEAFRGAEPDGGTVFEIGMAYANGARCYGYTRDRRSMIWKNQKAVMLDGKVLDEAGREHPYHDLAFCPSVIASTKIVEGDFGDCLKMLMTDIEEETKTLQKSPRVAQPEMQDEKHTIPKVFLSGPERYDTDALKKYTIMKQVCVKLGLDPLTPLDGALTVNPDDEPVRQAAVSFQNCADLIMESDAVIADLNDFRGWEPAGDTAFECGMAYQWGKKLFGYMNDTRRMVDRVPNLGKESEYKDACGNAVENFDYPINLMFSSSMEIFEGYFMSTVARIAPGLIENFKSGNR